MLISSKARGNSGSRYGNRPIRIAELRRHLAGPSQLSDGHRQRLLDLVQRVGRVQDLGGEYSRVSLSESVVTALNQKMIVV